MATGIHRLNDPGRRDEHGEPIMTVRDSILRDAEFGLDIEIASQAAGIHKSVLRLWIAAGRNTLTRLDAEPDATLTDEDLIAAQFVTDLEAAQGRWFRGANTLMERSARGKRTTLIRETQRVVERAGQDDQVTVVDRLVTTKDEPGDMGPLMWRMKQLNPERYGRDRLEVTGVDGAPIEVDIAAALDEHVAAIRAALVVEPSPEQNGHV